MDQLNVTIDGNVVTIGGSKVWLSDYALDAARRLPNDRIEPTPGSKFRLVSNQTPDLDLVDQNDAVYGVFFDTDLGNCSVAAEAARAAYEAALVPAPIEGDWVIRTSFNQYYLTPGGGITPDVEQAHRYTHAEAVRTAGSNCTIEPAPIPEPKVYDLLIKSPLREYRGLTDVQAAAKAVGHVHRITLRGEAPGKFSDGSW